jgi:hypothetical protein
VLRKGSKEKKIGSQEVRKPPDVPTALTTQDNQSSLKLWMKNLAFSAETMVSCNKIKLGEIELNSLLREFCFRGPPTPLILREKKSYLCHSKGF